MVDPKYVQNDIFYQYGGSILSSMGWLGCAPATPLMSSSKASTSSAVAAWQLVRGPIYLRPARFCSPRTRPPCLFMNWHRTIRCSLSLWSFGMALYSNSNTQGVFSSFYILCFCKRIFNIWSIKYRLITKLITDLICKLRDESNKPN